MSQGGWASPARRATHDAAVYVAARAPRVGEVKTRLGCAIGQAGAVMLYQAFLRDLAARFARAPFRLGWYVTPPDAWPELAPLVGPAGTPTRVLAQGAGDWTERQRDLFRGAAARGEERTILIASDSPHVSVEAVSRALAALDQHELVLGPVYDGGYYLIGMRGWHDVLADIRMSTNSVFGDIVARAHGLGLSVGQVVATFDVDVVDDLRYLRAVARRADLAATAAALAALGLLTEPALVGATRSALAVGYQAPGLVGA